MVKGLSIFTLAKKCIKGWYPTSKGGDNLLIPFVGVTNEEKFMYYVDYNPEISYVERADISDDFVQRYNLKKLSILPVTIEYEFEGKKHLYYPDFYLKLKSGETVIVEVGDIKVKQEKKELAKAIAAIDYCNKLNWSYWFIMSDNIISDIRRDNLILLKSYDKGMYAKSEIQQDILEILIDQRNDSTVKEIVYDIGKKYSERETEMALYELINYSAQFGRLDFDLDRSHLGKNSIIHILPAEASAILPLRINLPYEEIFEMYNSAENVSNTCMNENRMTSLCTDEMSEDDKNLFFNRRSAILEAISITRSESITTISNKYGIARASLYRLIESYIQYGDNGLINNNTYNGKDSYIDQDVKNIIVKIINRKPSWGATQLFESEEFKSSLTALSKVKNTIIKKPNYYQVYRFMKKYKNENSEILLDSKTKGKKGKVSNYGSFVKSVRNHLDIVQVDAHWLDIKITTKDRDRIAGRIWAIVFIDVKTSAIVGYSLSLKTPMEEDYMRALKCSIEQKDILVKRYACENVWPCNGIARRIMSDNGKIFISKRATDVLVKRLRIVEEVAPPYMPDVKGSIEALFTWIVNRLIAKMPGFTKGRERVDVEREVLQAGITFEEFEAMFVQAIVDVYNQEWDELRGQSRFVLWVASEKENAFGTPKWLGSKDELKLLLMKEEQKRKVDRHGVSFKGHFYQNKEMLGALVGKRVSTRYDKMDISVIYIYLDDGNYYCEAYCSEFLGRRISVWELESERKTKKAQKETCNYVPKRNLGKIVKHAHDRKQRERIAQAEEQSRLYDTYDVHIDDVNKVLENTRGKTKVVDFVPVNHDSGNFVKLDTRKL